MLLLLLMCNLLDLISILGGGKLNYSVTAPVTVLIWNDLEFELGIDARPSGITASQVLLFTHSEK
mgnify:CR=1 FL=1